MVKKIIAFEDLTDTNIPTFSYLFVSFFTVVASKIRVYHAFDDLQTHVAINLYLGWSVS